MSALKNKEAVIRKASKKDYDFVLINFANGDMVGHTGDLKAAIKAVRFVDKCLGELVEFFRDKGFVCIITADHGNVEEMFDAKKKERLSDHTLNPVPLIIISDQKYNLKKGILGNIAPTMLKIMGIKKPKEMTDTLIL